VKKKILLALLITVIIGIQPVFAQNDEAAPEPITEEQADEQIAEETAEETAEEEITEIAEIPQEPEEINERSEELSPEEFQKNMLDIMNQFRELLAGEKEEERTENETLETNLLDILNQLENLIAERPTEETPKKEPISDDHGPLLNNDFIIESRRLTKLAQEAYIEGDYDLSAQTAEEAIWYAQMSEVYIAITTARNRLEWAVSSGASEQYPVEYNEAADWYDKSIAFREEDELDESLDAAHKVIDILAYLGAGAPDGKYPLPATYTVRSWASFKDCFWNIAGHPWVYGDPHKWRILYNANRSKLPNPNNPNWIEPGMIIDIPSIQGETRQGAWDASRTYR